MRVYKLLTYLSFTNGHQVLESVPQNHHPQEEIQARRQHTIHIHIDPDNQDRSEWVSVLWYWPNYVVVDKGLLNGCVCSQSNFVSQPTQLK